MPISFPENPSVNDTFQINGRHFVWNGSKWRKRRARVEVAPPSLEVTEDFSAGGSALHVDSTNESVGIGTDSPNASDALTVGGDTSVTGNLSVSGVITVPTVSAATNDTKVATTEYVTTAISNLVGGAPSALDTLNELAAALNDDASYATTITNALALKLDSSSYTAADILTKIKTVDGASSGLDADTLDGSHASAFAASSHTHSYAASSHTHSYVPTSGGTVTGNFTAQGNLYVGKNGGGDSFLYFYDDNSNAWRSIYWDDSENRFRSGHNIKFDGYVHSKNNFYVGDNGMGDSDIYFYDDNSNTWRTMRWDDSVNDWRVEDNGGTMRTLYHSGNIPSYLSTSGGTISGSINVTSVCQSNEFQGDVGSSSDVTYMFDGDTDTGMYRYGSGEAALSGNGTWRTRTVGTGLAVNYYVNMSAGTYNHAVCGGAANAIAFRWASPYMKGSIDNVICANVANFSDARLKRNIRDWDNGIDILRQLRPVEYTPKDIVGFGEISGDLVEGYDPKDDIIGLIAQEVREVLPSAVDGDPEGSQMLSIAEDQLMAVIISAIQNIDTRLKGLEAS